jgi:hypothetical protein
MHMLKAADKLTLETRALICAIEFRHGGIRAIEFLFKRV